MHLCKSKLEDQIIENETLVFSLNELSAAVQEHEKKSHIQQEGAHQDDTHLLELAVQINQLSEENAILVAQGDVQEGVRLNALVSDLQEEIKQTNKELLVV